MLEGPLLNARSTSPVTGKEGALLENMQENPDDLATAAVTAAAVLRAAGNAALASGCFAEAVTKYQAALAELLAPGSAVGPQQNEAAAVLHANLSQAFLAAGSFGAAERAASRALAAQPQHAKALYRRATARLHLGRPTEALADAEKAHREAPSTATASLLAATEAAAAMPYAQPVSGDLELSEPAPALLAFAQRCMMDIRAAWLAGAPLTAQARMLHGTDAAEPGSMPKFGIVNLMGAFASAAALGDAAHFVRSQHFAAQAAGVCVIAPRSEVIYPTVWHAGTWLVAPPDAKGVFCEVHGDGEAAVWFLPATDDGFTLAEEVRLPQDCMLLEAHNSLLP